MIDYTIRGTVLPEIAKGFSFRVVNWSSFEPNRLLDSFYKKGELVSYGSKIYDNEIYVLADNPDYKGTNYLMFKLEDLNKLTKKETMENKNIIGYTLIKSEYAEAALQIEGGRFIGIEVKNGQILYSKYTESVEKLKNAGVLDLWFEPVYEDGFKVDDWVFWTGSYPTFAKIHKYNGGNCYTLNVNGNINSHNSCNKIHLRKATQEEIIKTQEQKIDISGIELTIKDNKVFHDKDNTDITEYVKAIKSLWETTLNSGNMTLGKYDFTIDNISIRKTGCRTVDSDIKSWLDVAKMIK